MVKFNEKTRMTPEWVARVANDNPVERLSNGNLRVFCRLAFANVLERSKKKNGEEGPFGVVVLLPEALDISLLRNAVVDLIKKEMPAALENQAIADKLHKPIKLQDGFVNMKPEAQGALYDGFVPGRLCISANSGNQPPCVDQNMAPIVDKRHCYSGAWAIVTLVDKWFKADGNQGPTFFLQSVMIVADDENLGGVGAANPNEDFKGVKVDKAVNPAAAFGATGHTAGAAASTVGGVDLFS